MKCILTAFTYQVLNWPRLIKPPVKIKSQWTWNYYKEKSETVSLRPKFLIEIRGGFEMGFYWDPESYIPNPGFLGFFFQKNRNRNIPEFFFLIFGIGIFFESDLIIPKIPDCSPLKIWTLFRFMKEKKIKEIKILTPILIFRTKIRYCDLLKLSSSKFKNIWLFSI